MNITFFRLQLWINVYVWKYNNDVYPSAKLSRSLGGNGFMKLLLALATLPEFDTSCNYVEEKKTPIKVTDVGALDGTDDITEFISYVSDKHKLSRFEGKCILVNKFI